MNFKTFIAFCFGVLVGLAIMYPLVTNTDENSEQTRSSLTFADPDDQSVFLPEDVELVNRVEAMAQANEFNVELVRAFHDTLSMCRSVAWRFNNPDKKFCARIMAVSKQVTDNGRRESLQKVLDPTK